MLFEQLIGVRMTKSNEYQIQNFRMNIFDFVAKLIE